MSNDVDDELDRMQGTIDSLRAENARLLAVVQDRDELREQVAAMEAAATGTSLYKTWREFSSQDVYGESFRDNMEPEDFDRLDAEIQDTGMELAKLREEAQTARLALDVADKEVAALRAKLKWFEEREPLVSASLERVVTDDWYYPKHEALEEWTRKNPPPGAAITFPPTSSDFGQVVAVSLHESITGDEDPEPGAAT